MRHRLNSQRGYSLIELLVAMMVMMIVMVGVYAIWNGLEKSYVFAEDDIRAQDEARLAMNEIIEYVRTGRMPASVPVGSEYLKAVIPKADIHELWLWTDVDRDVNHDLELVRFASQYDGSTGDVYLVRQESTAGDGTFDGAVTRVINQNVRNIEYDAGGNLIREEYDAGGDVVTGPGKTVPIFTYFDAKGQQLATPVAEPTRIREVRIVLHVDIDPTRQPYYHQIESTVQPRNLRQY